MTDERMALLDEATRIGRLDLVVEVSHGLRSEDTPQIKIDRAWQRLAGLLQDAKDRRRGR